MAKKIKTGNKSTTGFGYVMTLITLAGVAVSVNTSIKQSTSEEALRAFAAEDQNPIEYQLPEEETAEITNQDTVIASSNRFDNIKDSQSENSEIPNEVEVENGDIAEDLKPEIKDMVDEANKKLDENKNGNILNPDETNPEINPDQENSETIDNITSNLPDSETIQTEEQVKNIKNWSIAGGAAAALAGLGLTGIVLSKKNSYKKEKKSKKALNDFFMGGGK